MSAERIATQILVGVLASLATAWLIARVPQLQRALAPRSSP